MSSMTVDGSDPVAEAISSAVTSMGPFQPSNSAARVTAAASPPASRAASSSATRRPTAGSATFGGRLASFRYLRVTV